MPGLLPTARFGVASLTDLDRLEREYVEARVIRQLLVPRLVLLTAIVAGVVSMAQLPSHLFGGVLVVDAALIGVALGAERQAKRRWAAETTGVAAILGIWSQGPPPTHGSNWTEMRSEAPASGSAP